MKNTPQKPVIHFISGDTLKEWLGNGKAEMVEGSLSFRLDRQYVSSMSPALHFKRCISSSSDPSNLVGKVYEVWSLGSMGVSISGQGSAVKDGVAYDIEEGFMLTEIGPQKPAEKPAAQAREAFEDPKEVDMLASFVLSGLRNTKKDKA